MTVYVLTSQPHPDYATKVLGVYASRQAAESSKSDYEAARREPQLGRFKYVQDGVITEWEVKS